jgi:hypothetical protein
MGSKPVNGNRLIFGNQFPARTRIRSALRRFDASAPYQHCVPLRTPLRTSQAVSSRPQERAPRRRAQNVTPPGGVHDAAGGFSMDLYRFIARSPPTRVPKSWAP